MRRRNDFSCLHHLSSLARPPIHYGPYPEFLSALEVDFRNSFQLRPTSVSKVSENIYLKIIRFLKLVNFFRNRKGGGKTQQALLILTVWGVGKGWIRNRDVRSSRR